MGGGDACDHRHWGFLWGSLWDHEPCEGCAEMGRWGGMRALPRGPLVELLMGPRSYVRGVPK